MFGMLAVAMIKMWFWMRMNHLALLRELKRIELRLARGPPMSTGCSSRLR